MARLKDRFESIAQGEKRLGFDPLGTDEARMANLRLDQIEPDPEQPRKEIGSVKDLMASIKEHGVLQPIIVSPIQTDDAQGAAAEQPIQNPRSKIQTPPSSDRFRIVSGERRYTAAKALNLATIPAIVRTVEEHDKLEVQLIENLHRKDLTPIEEAGGYRRLMDEFGISQRKLAQRLGRSVATINETLRVLSLPAEVLEGVRTSEHPEALSRSALLEIAKLPGEKEQLDLWRRVAKFGLTVREARAEKSQAATIERRVPLPKPYHITFEVHRARVTVLFDRPGVTDAEVREALGDALEQIRPRPAASAAGD